MATNNQDAVRVDYRSVVDALNMAARKACCLESLAPAVVDGIGKESGSYRLAELLALDLSGLAVEIESIRDDLEDARNGLGGRFAA